ncbi:MAG: aspartyl/glutamyl-tRNA amidotransferase subunit C [Deltaproteobacteria bacterium]|nr:MAG: aspartyl/glutamyl-tRNA amidotransferase subunit C [Deltaproteobacteria bacterium]
MAITREEVRRVADDFGAYLRDDVATNPPAGDEPLANAPASQGRFFRVPRIIE